MNKQIDTAVNWLLEQFVTLYVLARFFGAINPIKKKGGKNNACNANDKPAS